MSLNNYRGPKSIQNLVSTKPTETYKLTSEQLKFYEDNGYLVITQLFNFISLSSYKQRFLQICRGVVDKGNILIVKEKSLVGKNLEPEDYINKIQDILYDDVFIKYGENPKLLHVLSQLIGDDITAVNSMFINKPPGSGLHPPHQKTNKFFHGILDGESLAPLDKRVNLEMIPGDTVLIHPYLVHGSGPNISKQYRKAITFHFASSDCEFINPIGTVQEQAVKDLDIINSKKGFAISYNDYLRLKSKQVKGVRSNL